MVKNIREKNGSILFLLIGILLGLAYMVLPVKLFALGLMAFLGLVLSVYDIQIALWAGVFLLPFFPNSLLLIYMYFLLFLYIYKSIVEKPGKLQVNKLIFGIFIYFIVILISTITSSDFKGSLRDLAIHMAGMSLAFVFVNTVDTKEKLNKILTFLVASASLVSLYGLYQYVVGVEMDAAWVDVKNNPDVRVRVYSVFKNPNILAEYLIMIIPISVALFWYNTGFWKKMLFLGTTLINVLAMLLTLSRGGWLGFAASALTYILLVDRRFLLLSIPAALGIVYLLPQTILNRLLSIANTNDSSSSYRFKIWQISTEVIRDNWLVGVGFGYIPFKIAFGKYTRTMPTQHAHNTILETLAELGVVGFLAFIFFLFLIFKYAILSRRDSEDKYLNLMMAGVVSGLVAVLTHGLVESVLYLPKIIISFWLLIALILTIENISKEKV